MMKGEKTCAVVIDCYRAEKTEKCLMSLSGQGIETAYVLDNSGSDGAALKLREALSRLQSAEIDCKIERLSAGKNLGFGKGVNFVLAHDRRSGSPHDYYLPSENRASVPRPLQSDPL